MAVRFPERRAATLRSTARDNAVRASAAHDLSCDPVSIRVGHFGMHAYADGCGKRAVYALRCSLEFGDYDCPMLLTSAFVLPTR